MSDSQRSDRDDGTLGMLVWTVPVRLLDVSRSGCQVEVGRYLEIGTNGQLHVEKDGLMHLDDVRVCRCQSREGASRIYRAGVELLRTRRLSRRSLRLVMRQIIGETGGAPTETTQEHAGQPAAVSRQAGRKRAGCRAPPMPVPVDT